MPLLGLLLVVAGLCLVPMSETDLFFRLKIGDEILRTGSIPRHNLFSFTFPDQPTYDPAWLFDLAAAALYRLGGFPAVVIGKTLIVVGVFAGAYLVCRRRGATATTAALVLAAAALVMRDRLVERPHLFSLAGEVAVLVALTSRRRAWLVPATILWANLHAGAFLAPVLLVLAFAGATIDLGTLEGSPGPPAMGSGGRSPPTPDATIDSGTLGGSPIPPAMGSGGRSPPTPDAIASHARAAEWSTLALAGACAAALLVTPVGAGLFRYLAFHVGLYAVHPIDEFRPINWISDAPLICFAAAVAVMAAVARPRWRDALPVLGLALLALRSARFGADFALVAAPLAAAALARLPAVQHRRAGAIVGATLIVLALAPRALARQRPRIGLDTSELPLDAIAFAEANGLRDRMYNDLDVGAYLLWEGWPRHRVFVDPRLPDYPRAFHRLLGDAHLDRTAWDAALESFGVTSALIAYAGINHRVSWWDPARWALVYRAHDARVFVRRLPRFRPLIAAREIPATFGFTMAEGATTIPLEAPPPGSPVPACEWQRRLGDLRFELDGVAEALPAYRRALEAPGCLARADELTTAAWVGAELMGRGQAAEALPYLERGGDDLTTLTNRALVLDALGRRDEAAAIWAAIAERAKGTPLGERAARRAARR